MQQLMILQLDVHVLVSLFLVVLVGQVETQVFGIGCKFTYNAF